jgi:hypothetical protein
MERPSHIRSTGKLGKWSAAILVFAILGFYGSLNALPPTQASPSEFVEKTLEDWIASPIFKEISNLDRLLGDQACVKRQQAYQRLREIGTPVVKFWQLLRPA